MTFVWYNGWMGARGTIHSPTKQKILLLLESGFRLSLTRSVGKQKRILRRASKAWGNIDRHQLYRHLREFHHDRLISYRENSDDSIDIILTDAGERRALSFKIDELTLKRKSAWNGKWQMVAYDIPHAKRGARDALGRKLRELGFYQWQKSVLVYPFPCRDEVDFIVEVFEVRPYVRYAEITNPTNVAELKIKFDLK